MDPTDSKHQKWFPLESNPTLMNQYIHQLGWDVSQYHLVDVFSTDDWALEMIPTPVLAVLLLYPLTPVQLQHEQQEREQLLQQRQQQQKSPTDDDDDDDDRVWFIKQRIGNACGTIGLLHAMMNAVQQKQQEEGTPPLIQPGSWLDHFYQATTGTIATTTTTTGDHNITAVRRAELLEDDPRIATYHDQATSSTDNQTSRGASVDDDIITHFIALVAVAGRSSGTGSHPGMNTTDTTTTATPPFGHLYELDGRKGQPICHTTIANPNMLLREACTVIKEQFMARDPNELRFTILALAKNNPDDE